MCHRNFNRNKDIAKRVFDGEKLLSVGIDYELSTSGVIRAVHAYCKLANPTRYKLCPQDKYERKIEWLKNNRTFFNL